MGKKSKSETYRLVVIGTSSGGIDALSIILPALDRTFPLPILIVQHISPTSDSFLITYLNKMCSIRVKEAEDKETIKPGTAYLAPPDYHLMVEKDQTLSLSNDERVNFARPSIDVLFETAAWVYRQSLIGIILTGANWDGASGLAEIKRLGGYTIVEDPSTAEVARMPESALEKVKPDEVVKLNQIADSLSKLIK